MTSEIPDTRALEDLTWREIETALENGFDTIILPLGATEQHGPHLPVGTDTELVTEIATRLAKRLDQTLVAPAVPVGPSEEHAAFPGTVSISTETLQRLLRDYVSSFERQEFDRVILLPGHGGCFPVVQSIQPEVARESALDVVAITDLGRYMELLSEGLAEAGIDVDVPFGHAGGRETALMLAVTPGAVRDEPAVGYEGKVSAAALFNSGIEAYSKSGILGDARPATAEAGRTALEHVVTAYAEYVRDEVEELEKRR